jgi:hypothetical protein|nr:MAG TPA: hypothetical protein [Caudoviricetes sp.]
MIQDVNKATGELCELDASTPEAAAIAYEYLTQMEAMARRMKQHIKQDMLVRMGDDEELDAGNGYVFKFSSRASKYAYHKPTLKKYLDEDAMDSISVVDVKAADKLVKELKESGVLSDEEIKELNDAKYVENYTSVFKLEVQ